MRRTTLFWAVILILIGVLLLLNNLDVFGDIDVWGWAWALGLIAVGIWVLWGAFAKPGSFEAEEATIPLEGAGQARIRMRHGAGRLNVRGGAGPDELLHGTFGGGLDHRTRWEGDVLNVEMRVPTPTTPFVLRPWQGGWGGGLEWSVYLNDEVKLSVDLDTGASDSRLDLSGLQVVDLHVNTGASALHLTLPADAGHTRARIDGGAASITVRIPLDVAARIRSSGGLSSINVDRGRFPRMGKVYQSPDYETAVNKVDLFIDIGVGSASVR